MAKPLTKKVLSRRTLLRGAGTVAIALPLLPAMRVPLRADTDPPARAFNVFFGLGFPTPLQDEGYAGPLGALAPLRDKLCVVRGVDQVRADVGGANAHYDGSGSSFCAMAPDGTQRSGGETMDQALRRAAYPDGLPPGVPPSLVMGTYFRRSDRPYRYIHSWNADGSPADLPKETPRALFDRLFGTDGMEDPSDPAEELRQRRRRSVLDSVLGQVRHLTSDAGGLGAASRARLRDHLDRLREHERRVFPEDGPMPSGCVVPGRPASGSPLPHGESADPGGEGVDVTLEDLRAEWRLMADLYALGIQCDRVRFGSVTFLSAGERIRLTGSFSDLGEHVYDFDDRRDRGRAGAQGCSHEFWHAFNTSNPNTQLRAHLRMKLSMVRYFLEQLDDPAHADENGGTILDNAMITISTESGDGRHNDVRRELSGIFHAISGANGRFRTGEILDVGAEGIDLYNTMLMAHGAGRPLGPGGRGYEEVSGILR